MALRFANGMFEPLWNRDRIDHVQITVAETVGVETRGRFYEKTGALRDMVPNHVFQLLAMVAMEPPGGFDANAVRGRKADVFAAMRTVEPEDAVRGQYGPGPSGVLGYRQEKDVAPDSGVETYVAMQLAIDNWRWAGVPFYLRTGKHMSRRVTEIAIRFKPAPFAPFEDTDVAALPPNWLLLQIQPEEGIALQFEVKRPGPVVDLAAVRMAFKYADWFPKEPNIGYETLIYDVMIGDQTLFNRADMVEETWRVVGKVLDALVEGNASGFPELCRPAAMARRRRTPCWRARPSMAAGHGRRQEPVAITRRALLSSGGTGRLASRSPWRARHPRWSPTPRRKCLARHATRRNHAGQGTRILLPGILSSPGNRLVERRQHLTVAGVVVHALDVVEPAAHRHRQQHRVRPGLRPVQVQQSSRAAQRANRTTAAVACLIPPLHPILPVLDQRSADRQDLHRDRIRLIGRYRLERVQWDCFRDRRRAQGKLDQTRPDRRLRGRTYIAKSIIAKSIERHWVPPMVAGRRLLNHDSGPNVHNAR